MYIIYLSIESVSMYNGIDLMAIKQTLESIRHTNDLNFLSCKEIMNKSAIFIIHAYEVLIPKTKSFVLFTYHIADYSECWFAIRAAVNTRVIRVSDNSYHIKLKCVLIRK